MNNYIQRMKMIIDKNDIPFKVVEDISKRIGMHILSGGKLEDYYIKQQLDYLIKISEIQAKNTKQ